MSGDHGPPRTWIILGCGYTGTFLAQALLARTDLADGIVVTRRDREAAHALGMTLGVRGERADLAELGQLAAPNVPASSIDALEVPASSVVVCTAPPGADPAGEIRALLATSRSASRIVYISSTGVYGPGRGAWVDETWPIAPFTKAGRDRAAAEATLATSSVPWVALRAAGIYGPGRALSDRIRTGAYRVVGDGTSHVSRIHVADLVSAILAAGTSSVTGAINAADDDPAPSGEVADAIAARLGMPPPPRIPPDTVPPEVAGMLTADRRIANRRMREELGIVLRYPSWRVAIDEELP